MTYNPEQRRALGTHGRGDRFHRNGLGAHGRRPLRPGEEDLRQRFVGARVEGRELKLIDYFEPIQLGLAAEARSGYAGDSRHLSVQRPRTDGHRQQGMPHVSARHQIGRRSEPPDSARPHAADVQRGSRFPIRRNLGQHGQLGTERRNALGAHAFLGAGPSRFQDARLLWAGHARRHRGPQGGRTNGGSFI